jgi:hypothetical protein
MANSIQKNSSSVISEFGADMSEIKQVSQENEKIFRTLLDSLYSLNDELIKLDAFLRDNSLGNKAN